MLPAVKIAFQLTAPVRALAVVEHTAITCGRFRIASRTAVRADVTAHDSCWVAVVWCGAFGGGTLGTGLQIRHGSETF